MLDSPVASEVPGVHTDFHAAGRIAAEHLIARGLRRLAHFGFTDTGPRNGFMRACARSRANTVTPARVMRSVPTTTRVPAGWERFVDCVKSAQAGWEAPMGVGFTDDGLCRLVASVCVSAGWDIPDQLAMVGAGNDMLICSALDPTLSSIEMGDRECGYEAAGLLDRLMNGGKPPKKIQYSPPRELLVRQSSDVFAVSDPKVAKALRYMADHSGVPLSVPEIAQIVGLGRQSLQNRFHQHLGRSINDELIRLRVSKLKRLLVESDEPVKTLGDEAGFGTTVSMHTMFKRHTGMTPKAYREKHAPARGVMSSERRGWPLHRDSLNDSGWTSAACSGDTFQLLLPW